MDGQLLAQLQKELRSFEDRQLWALVELAVAELDARGRLDSARLPTPPGPDVSNRRTDQSE